MTKRDITKVIEHAQRFLAAMREVGWQEAGRDDEDNMLLLYPSTGETCTLLELYERYKAHGVEAL